MREGDTVARLGGDEFAVLIASLKDESECELALGRILAAVAEPYTVAGTVQDSLSASVGVTLFPTDNSDPDTLLRHADHAMYAAKQAGKNNYKLFNPEHERRIRARHDTVRWVESALMQGQLILHYQPQVNCREGFIAGVEALIRWQHPVLGLLQPADFLPLIADNDVSLSVGEWVIREALRQMMAWSKHAISLPISVNVFTRQLQNKDFASKLQTILTEYTVAKLELEILEKATLEDIRETSELVRVCGTLGVSFSLDDFGSGCSSLDLLRQIPTRALKIDKSFVHNMLTHSEDRAIVEGILGLGHAFGREVVAEGVESTELIRSLLAIGCDVMQGYALARPMRADACADWVADFRPDPLWKQKAPLVYLI